MVSTAGATGSLVRRAAFFTGARLGLALATVRFTLRALPRVAAFLFCTFDRFLRLAMIDPPGRVGFGSKANPPCPCNPSDKLSTGRPSLRKK